MGFTTKDGGRGFGMYIVKKIIDEAKGTIDFKVDEGVQMEYIYTYGKE